MDQLVKEETQKLLANQMRDARLQRQKQVRQQAMAWTEATRRKFEQTKEREIRGLANTVTGQVQNAAMLNIEQLTRQNDLAMAEIGMAHRAAAGFQNVERMKSLKRLRNEEVANNRGTAAMMKHLKQKEAEKSKNMALLKRKEEVRKAEDKLSKDLISRRPLAISNSNVKPKVKFGPPEYQQGIAKTLKTASTEKKKHRAKPSKPSTDQNAKAENNVRKSRSSSTELIPNEKPKKPTMSKEGILKKMVRIKASSPSKAGINFESDDAWEAFSTVKDLYGIGYKLRSKYMKAARGTDLHIPIPVQSAVRYFDSNIPKGEVKYVAPPGLAVKETSESPDAWEKGRHFSEELVQQQKNKTQKEEKITQKAAERGKLALKKAKLEREILQVRNELLEDIDFELLGTGSQKAILGLEEESENKKGSETDAIKSLNETVSSDEFSAVDSDEEFIWNESLKDEDLQLSGTKSQNAIMELKEKEQRENKVDKTDTAKQLNDVVSSDKFSPVNSDEELQEIQKSENKVDETDTTKQLNEAVSSDEFSPVNSDEEYTWKDQQQPAKPSKKISGEAILFKMAKSMMRQKEEKTSSQSLDTSKGSINKSNSSEKTDPSLKVKSSSSSTLAEINVRTTSDKIRDHRPSSLQDLHERAKEQEKLLQESPAVSNSTSASDLQEDSRQSEVPSTQSSLELPVEKAAAQPRTFPNGRKESSSKKVPRSSISSNSLDSNKSSVLVSIKIKPKPLSNDSKVDTSSILTSSSNSNSDESSALVNLKILENSESTPSRTNKSSDSTTTDYYSPPDGPFTSTPDGKLHHKGNRSESSSEDSLGSLKRRTLSHYLNKFLERKPGSIEKLSITTSSSSVIRADSDVIKSESFQSAFDGDSSDGRKQNSTQESRYSNKYSSDSTSSSKKRALLTLYEDLNRTDSGSTIAETAIVAGRIVSNNTTIDSTDSSQIKDETPPKFQHSSSNDAELVSSDSLTGLIRYLSSQQEIEMYHLGHQDSNSDKDLERSFGRSSRRTSDSNNQTIQSQVNQSNALLSSSKDSIPDASAILRRLMSKRSAHNTSRSSASSSSKSGPERETKRVELLDDVSPIKLWETPPRTNQAGANDTQKLSAVFETLIDKWSNMKIEKPPWTSQSDHDQKEKDS